MDRRTPAAMVVDLRLPGVDGVTFLQQLRRTHGAIPAAAMTGDYRVDDRLPDALKELGTRLFFKPLWEEDLVAIVQTLVTTTGEFSDDRGKVPIAGIAR